MNARTADHAQRRVHEIETALGDPLDLHNPVGSQAMLRADEASMLSAAGEQLLDDLGINAEFVPIEHGGRFEQVDTMVRTLRQVFARDVALGLGYGVTSYMAAVNVWAAGTAEQQRQLARVLLANKKVAVAYHEIAHGNDFVRNEFSALHSSDNLLLNGQKHVINNAERAAAWVLFSRTSQAVGSRSHSVVFIDRDQVPPGQPRFLPRYETVGVRGCYLGGLDFDHCAVPQSTMVGAEGQGVEIALRFFQISRSAVPGMALGAVDASLRTVIRFALGRQLYRRNVMNIPHARTTLANAFIDLLIADSFCMVGTRALHVLPGETSVYAAAVKYLVPRIVTDTMHELSIVLGARFYVRDGDFGMFQKHVRDLPVLSLGHAGSAACQSTIIPQLHRLAKRSWFTDEAAPEALYTPGGPLPPLDYDRLILASRGDAVSATLVEAASALPNGTPAGRVLNAITLQLMNQLLEIQEQSLALPAVDRTALASPGTFALADRYSLVLAAASVIGVWRSAANGPDEFLADPAWAAAALHRIARRLGLGVSELPAEVTERVHEELDHRYRANLSFDLYRTPLAGSPDALTTEE